MTSGSRPTRLCSCRQPPLTTQRPPVPAQLPPITTLFPPGHRVQSLHVHHHIGKQSEREFKHMRVMSVRIREHPRTSANVRERPRTSANVRERPRTSANFRERPRTSANVRERPRTWFASCFRAAPGLPLSAPSCSPATRHRLPNFMIVFVDCFVGSVFEICFVFCCFMCHS